MKKIEKAIDYLLRTKPFYAHFFLNTKVVMDKYNVPTAACALTKDNVVLVFNSKFLEQLQPAEIAAVVEHETMHLLFDHVQSMAKSETELGYNRYIMNIAMDCAINQFIQNLPKGGVTFELINKLCGGKLEERQTWEYYYSKLLVKADEAKKRGLQTTDEHDANIPDKVSDGQAKEVLRSAMDSAIKASKGNVPEQVLKTFGELSGEVKIPWQQVLSNFVARSASNITLATRKKVNRRFGLTQPGKKKKRELTLGICVDSSGSVSDESFQQFLVEIQRITKQCTAVHFVEADCVVQNTQKIKKGGKMQLSRTGCGGTAYQPAIDECMKRNCDAIIYFGDGDSADTPGNPRIPFLWVLVGNQKPPGDFGSLLRL